MRLWIACLATLILSGGWLTQLAQQSASIAHPRIRPIAHVPLFVRVATSTLEGEAGAREAEPSEVWDAYRDGSGRLRFEPVSGAGRVAAVEIIDPPGGLIAFLLPPNRAMRFRFRPVPPGAYSIMGGPGVGLLFGEKGKRTVVTEKLGRRMMEDAEFQGELTTVTVEGERTLVATDEDWSSSELGLVGLEIRSERGRRTTSILQKLVRGEQPPSLFAIPENYIVQDAPSPQPEK